MNKAQIGVYCSGSILKGTADDGRTYWTDVERNEVASACLRDVVFLNPDDPIPAGASLLAQFGRDMYQIAVADAVIVDARERRGLGVGVEMLAAKSLGAALIIVAPPNTKYRQDSLAYRGTTVSSYVHPHVSALADDIVSDFSEAGRKLTERVTQASLSTAPVVPSVAEAIRAYASEALQLDAPMLKALDRLGRQLDVIS